MVERQFVALVVGVRFSSVTPCVPVAKRKGRRLQPFDREFESRPVLHPAVADGSGISHDRHVGNPCESGSDLEPRKGLRRVAQGLEHRSDTARAGGSNPPTPTPILRQT